MIERRQERTKENEEREKCQLKTLNVMLCKESQKNEEAKDF